MVVKTFYNVGPKKDVLDEEWKDSINQGTLTEREGSVQ
jgi:hypothetical protein